MHKHHIIPRSRGGGDNPDNIVMLSPYDHALHHAYDFLEGGPWFDCRHAAWPLLPESLREEVKLEQRRRKKGQEPPKTFESLSAAGKVGGSIAGPKTFLLGLGIHGMTAEEKTKRSKKCASITNSQRWKCRVTGYVSTPSGLTSYQKARGIDTHLRDRYDD
jgi:hypothetical protein